MQPTTSQIKTTEDLLLNYTNVEVGSGVYANNTLFKLFKNIEKDLKFVEIDENNHTRAAVYEYAVTPEMLVNIYINSKYDYLELVHFYVVPEFFDDNYIDIINISNRNMKISRAVSTHDDMSSVEVAASYNGEFSSKGFLRFMNGFHQDVIGFHKVNSIYLSSMSEAIESIKNSNIIKTSIDKSITKSPIIKTLKKIASKKVVGKIDNKVNSKIKTKSISKKVISNK